MEKARTDTMTGPWAARIAVSKAMAAAILRLRPDVRAALVADALWLRGDSADADMARLLDRVAPHGRYEIDAGDQLRPMGRRLPVSVLPNATWRPLSEILSVVWPVPRATSTLPGPVAFRLVRTDHERQANALLTELPSLEHWAASAAAIRLAPLRFAATASHALVLGQPVPPIAGVCLYESHGIVVPCGWKIAPAIDPQSLHQFLNLDIDDLALFSEFGWQLITADGVVRLTRSAVRLTTRGTTHG